MSLSDYKISTKLVLAFVLVSLIGAALGLFAIRNMGVLNDADTALYENETVGLSLVKEANVQRYAAVVALRDAILATNMEGREGALQRIATWRAISLELLNEARGKASDPETLAAFAKVDEAWKADQAALDGILQLLKSSEMNLDTPVLQFLGASVVQPSIKVGGTMSDLTKVFEGNAHRVSEGNTALYERSRNITLGLIVICVLIGVGLGVVISRSVTRPLGLAMETARAVAEGICLAPSMREDRRNCPTAANPILHAGRLGQGGVHGAHRVRVGGHGQCRDRAG